MIKLLRFNTEDKRIYIENIEANNEQDVLKHIAESTLEMIGEEEDQPITIIKKYLDGIDAFITEKFQTHHIGVYAKQVKHFYPSTDDLEEDGNSQPEKSRKIIKPEELTEAPIDKGPIKCSKCSTVYGRLGHLELYNKPICNKCCDTAIMENGLFKGCSCG